MSKQGTIAILVVGFIISGTLGTISANISGGGYIVGLTVMIIGILATIYVVKPSRKISKNS